MTPISTHYGRRRREAGLPVHIHTGQGNEPWPGRGNRPAAVTNTTVSHYQALSSILWSGILELFPKLQFVSVEANIGWIPYFLEKCEVVQPSPPVLEQNGASPTPGLLLQAPDVRYLRRRQDGSGHSRDDRGGQHHVVLGLSALSDHLAKLPGVPQGPLRGSPRGAPAEDDGRQRSGPLSPGGLVPLASGSGSQPTSLPVTDVRLGDRAQRPRQGCFG